MTKKLNGEIERLSLFDQTDSEFSETDNEETEFEREFIDANRLRSLRKHKENSLNSSQGENSINVVTPPASTSRSNASNSLISSNPQLNLMKQLSNEEIYDADTEPLFITEPSSHLICNICHRVMRRPVVTQCGHTYCAGCVVSRGADKCPVDDIELVLVLENIALREQISALMVYCKFGCEIVSEDGTRVYTGATCTEQITFGRRKEHEDSCPWSHVPCPNNSALCGTLLSRDIASHVIQCRHAVCINKMYGCKYTGTKGEVETHVDTDCKFVVVRGVVDSFKSTVDMLVHEVSNQTKQIKQQSKQIRKLTKTVELIEQENSIRDKRIEDIQNRFNTAIAETSVTLGEMSNEMNNIQAQLGMVGDIQQHIFKCKGTFVGHQGPIWSMASAGDLLFSGSGDHSIKVWDTLANFTCVKSLLAHEGMVLSLCVSGDKLYSSASDNRICVWDLTSYRLVDSITEHKNPVCTLAADQSFLYSGSLRVINVWDKDSLELVHSIDDLNHWVRALVIRNTKMFVGIYQAIKIFDIPSFKTERIIDINGGSVYSMVVTDKWIICGTYERGIQLHSTSNPSVSSHFLTGHTGTVYCLGLYSSGGHTRLFSGANDRTIKVWNVDKKIPSQTLDRHQGSVCCLVVGKGKIFSGAMDSTIKVWQ